MEKRLANISILVHDRHNWSLEVNKVLTEYGNLILSRLGTNLQRQCIENCTALIVAVAEGAEEELNEMAEKLNKLDKIDAKILFLS